MRKSKGRDNDDFATQTSGVNFTNILGAAFTCADPKSAKKLLNLTVFFALLGSAHVKAAHKHVDEIDPGRRRRHRHQTSTTRDLNVNKSKREIFKAIFNFSLSWIQSFKKTFCHKTSWSSPIFLWIVTQPRLAISNNLNVNNAFLIFSYLIALISTQSVWDLHWPLAKIARGFFSWHLWPIFWSSVIWFQAFWDTINFS